ncbi:hypothetical protein ACFXG4_27300 [Nocardia sp. NPDC059246]|uniref:hypothetical protein n=1 Tax=unclassified Nocardia TaxID=2637762 RepID=UPI0036B98C94
MPDITEDFVPRRPGTCGYGSCDNGPRCDGIHRCRCGGLVDAPANGCEWHSRPVRATDQQINDWEAWFDECGVSAVTGAILAALRAERIHVANLLQVLDTDAVWRSRRALEEYVKILEGERALLKQKANAPEQLDALQRLQRLLGWRCMATTSGANFFTIDDHRAVWCTLPNGHAGWHQGEIENKVLTGIADVMKTRRSEVNWSDVQEPARQPEDGESTCGS